MRGERRRVDRLGEDADAGAFERLLRGEGRANHAEKRRPRADFAEVRQRSRAIGIVEPKNRGLREDIARAQTRRMERIPFDLRRPAFVGFDEQSGGRPAQAHRRRVEERLAGNDLFGLTHVRDDLFFRLPRARRQTGERDRRAHQFHERASCRLVGNGFDLRRKFVVEPLAERRIVRQFVRACARTRVSPSPNSIELDRTLGTRVESMSCVIGDTWNSS